MLQQLEIPAHGIDRSNQHPLIFGGGPVLTANPEPFAAFFDVILIGDGEILLGEFISAYAEVRTADRATKLRRLAQVPGVYIPSLYEVTYDGDHIAAHADLYVDQVSDALADHGAGVPASGVASGPGV